MNLIDRYVTEVGKYLPRKNRLDIEAELRSTLEDMLEDRSQQTGRPADEALASELLQEYGSPRKVAATYQTHPYLIGPRMFPTYTLLLKFVFFAVTLGLTIATVVSMIGSNLTMPELLKSLGDFAVSLLSALAAAFGNVTLIFAVLERVMPVPGFEEKETWTPAKLTAEPDPGQAKMGETIVSIIFTSAALIIFNFYPQIIGIWNLQNGTWTQMAGLSEAFFRYLPWINLTGVLTIALHLWLLRTEVWSVLTRLMHIVLQIIGIGIAAAMLRGPALLEFYPGAIPSDVETVVTNVFNWIVPVVLIIVIVTSTVEIVKDLVRMLRPDKQTFPSEKGA